MCNLNAKNVFMKNVFDKFIWSFVEFSFQFKQNSSSVRHAFTLDRNSQNVFT